MFRETYRGVKAGDGWLSWALAANAAHVSSDQQKKGRDSVFIMNGLKNNQAVRGGLEVERRPWNISQHE